MQKPIPGKNENPYSVSSTPNLKSSEEWDVESAVTRESRMLAGPPIEGLFYILLFLFIVIGSPTIAWLSGIYYGK